MADAGPRTGEPPEGWYPDPQDPEMLRRWDGSAWTDQRMPSTRARRRIRAGEDAAPEVAGDGGHVTVPQEELARLEAEVARLREERDAELERRRNELAELQSAAERDAGRRAEEIAGRERAAVQAVDQRRTELEALALEEEEVLRRTEQHRVELAAAEEAARRETEERAAAVAEAERVLTERQRRLAAEEEHAVRAAEQRLSELTGAEEGDRRRRAELDEEIDRRRAEIAVLEEAARAEVEAAHADAEQTRAQLAAEIERRRAEIAEQEERARAEEEQRRARLAADEAASAELLARTRSEREALERQVAQARADLVDLGERAAAEELGLYDYRHPAEDTDGFDDRLLALRQEIVRTALAGEAVSVVRQGKRGRGKAVPAEDDVAQLCLRAYNAEAENALRVVVSGGVDGALTRLLRARGAVARHGASGGVSISEQYHDLRVKEIELAEEARVHAVRARARAAQEQRPAAPSTYPAEYRPSSSTPPAGGTYRPGESYEGPVVGWTAPTDPGPAQQPFPGSAPQDRPGAAWPPQHGDD